MLDKMKKKGKFSILILFYILLSQLFTACNHPINGVSEEASSLKWIEAGTTHDTIFSKDKIITNIKFLNIYAISAVFRYDNDFSFLYPEYFEKWSIYKNNIPLEIETSSIDWASFFLTNDSILHYQNSNARYFLIFNRPFYCNGFACDDIGILILKETETRTNAYYYNTQLGSDSLIVHSIEELTKSRGSLALPVGLPDTEKDSIRGYILVDSLKPL